MVITKNPETGKRNTGCYRMQVYDSRTTGMHWQTQKHGADHYRSSRSKNPNGKLEVAVAIGADPATALAGILPVPPDMDEFMFSGFLRKDPVDLVACKTVDLEVPANAEIVLEGYVEIGEIMPNVASVPADGRTSRQARSTPRARRCRRAPPGIEPAGPIVKATAVGIVVPAPAQRDRVDLQAERRFIDRLLEREGHRWSARAAEGGTGRQVADDVEVGEVGEAVGGFAGHHAVDAQPPVAMAELGNNECGVHPVKVGAGRDKAR